MSSAGHGIIYTAANNTVAGLPLEEVRVKASIVDVSACVSLIQVYRNPEDSPTSRAKYVFPLPARAAVCAFEIDFQDGRVIEGVCKEKAEAARDFQAAIQSGKAAGLVEWVLDDAFVISIGSIPAREVVTTKLIFVMDLMDDGFRDQIRLQLPMSVGPRYGVVPANAADAAAASKHTRLKITVEVQTSGVIHSIESPTHAIALAPYVTRAGAESRRRRTAKFRSPDFLQHDFVLSVRADGLDAPRCFAELDPRGSGTVALQLTLVPKFKFRPIPSQEYLFVIDRSGSMTGPRIQVAKEALLMLLHMLPNSSTSFNIFSFGSHVDGYYSTSSPYNAQTLQAATIHISSIDADYGGTELAGGLRYSLAARNMNLPTVAFILTDGETFDVDPVIAEVQHAVQAAHPSAPLRVFSLGIGSTVSSAVVEGIARAGHGEALFAAASEDITARCAKLMRAGRTSHVENVAIDWGVPRGARSAVSSAAVNFDTPEGTGQKANPRRLRLGPLPSLQQVPHTVEKIYPGLRTAVFAITAQKTIPKEVILRGKFDGEDTPFELSIPVSSVRSFNKSAPALPFLHVLAARSLITEFLEGRAPLPPAVDAATPEEVRKAAVIRLGEQYQLASIYTSFVAVDDGQDVRRDRSFVRTASQRNLKARRRSILDSKNDDGRLGGDTSTVSSGIGFLMSAGVTAFSDMVSAVFGLFNPPPASSSSGRQASRDIPRRYSGAPQAPGSPYTRRSGRSAPNPQEEDGYDSTATFSTLSSLFSQSSWDSTDSFDEISAEDAARMRSPSPTLQVQASVPRLPNAPSSSRPPFSADPPARTLLPPEVSSLIHLQSFDGSFRPDPALAQIFGVAEIQKPPGLQGDDTTWATALAAAYLQRILEQASQPDLLDGLLDKIREFVENKGISDADFDDLVKHAKDALNGAP